MSPAEEFSAFAHELAHDILHHQQGAARLPKTVMEARAEAVAYVICRGAGLETNLAAADYSQLYNGEKETLLKSLSVIHENAKRILDQLLPEQRPSPFHEKAGRSLSEVPGRSQGESRREQSGSRTPAAESPDRAESISLER